MIDESKFSNILYGKTWIKPYWYTYCPLRMRILADIYKKKCSKEFTEEGLYKSEEFKELLKAKGFWLLEDEKAIAKLYLDLENAKVQAYEKSSIDWGQCSIIKEQINNKIKPDLLKLIEKRHAYDHLSVDGLSDINKNKFVIASCIVFKKRRLINSIKAYNDLCSKDLEDIIVRVKNSLCTETEIRYFARSEQWRSMWSARKSGSPIFNIPTIKMSDEQRSIILWSTIYDNIAEHPECPQNKVIEDDDLLDGWMILQKRNREAEQKKTVDFTRNDKIKNSQEVYVVAKDFEHAKEIEAMNDLEASIIKDKRYKQMQAGEVAQQNLTDVRLDLRKQAWEAQKRG